jgi:hypothetical protein
VGWGTHSLEEERMDEDEEDNSDEEEEEEEAYPSEELSYEGPETMAKRTTKETKVIMAMET